MARIIGHDAEGIAESCGGLIESDTMLTPVRSRLLRVPLEGNGHWVNYAFRDVFGMRLT